MTHIQQLDAESTHIMREIAAECENPMMVGAAEFCRTFDTGGGRKLSGGVNYLPKECVDHFTSSFAGCFGTRQPKQAWN